MSVVYTGPDPIAKHQSLSPGYARTTGAGTGSIILGEANDRKKTTLFLALTRFLRLQVAHQEGP